MPDIQRQSVGMALGRLRWAVTTCCWIIGLALAAQVLIWSLISFTDLRFQTLQGGDDAPLIVEGPSPREKTMQTITVDAAGEPAAREPVDTNRVISRWDRVFASTVTLTRGAGLLALLAMIPMIAMGVLIGAGSATPGVENTVSSFCWATLTALLIAPVGSMVDLPWAEGGLASYDLMILQLGSVSDHVAGAGAVVVDGSVINLAHFVALPAVCIAGLALVGLRFSAGVHAALLPREDMHLDPELEKEVANIRPTSLMGGRAAGALSQAVRTAPESTLGGSPVPPMPPAQRDGPATIPRAREVSPGEAPKRLI